MTLGARGGGAWLVEGLGQVNERFSVPSTSAVLRALDLEKKEFCVVTHPVLATGALSFPWPTPDPFLFCAFHDDLYPKGTAELGPHPSLLVGRDLGQDFAGKDGWRMYHGEVVPGFPQHPHRGFETVTVVRRGLLDHSDSLRAAARFGRGDVQWLTAGKGILHAEMFPLLQTDAPNPLELFQIWLNLPRSDKLADPHFTMFWDRDIPTVQATDMAGRRTEIRVVAGALGEHRALPPPPRSYASRPESDVAIWTIKLEPQATWTLPQAAKGSQRRLYFFRGREFEVGGRPILPMHYVDLRVDQEAPLRAGAEEVELLLLQGRPLEEPVVQYGPFVMNSPAEIQQAFLDYRQTQFGGWPWPSSAPVHPKDEGRFARHADGRLERPTER